MRNDAVYDAETDAASAAADQILRLFTVKIHGLVNFDFVAVNVDKSAGNIHGNHRNACIAGTFDDFVDKTVFGRAQFVFAQSAVGQKLGRKRFPAVG